jgi:membrane associated rhomboid family serine protease
MSSDPGSASGTGRAEPAKGGRWSSSRWSIGNGDAETVLAEARKALFVMVAILVVLWVVQIANWADNYHLTYSYGIRTRDVARLPDILTAPFLHFSWSHIEGNSGPLFIFGFLAAYRGVARFVGVTVLVVLVSGLAAWFTQGKGTVGAGASGVVFGYFGYIMVRGFFDRHPIDMLLGAVMALCFAYQFSVLLPHTGIDWQAHIGGLVGGVAAGWIFRERRPAGAAKPASKRKGPGQPPGNQGPPSSRKAVLPTAGDRSDLYKQLDDMGL